MRDHRRRRRPAAILATLSILASGACAGAGSGPSPLARLRELPEWNPDVGAPPTSQHSWKPSSGSPATRPSADASDRIAPPSEFDAEIEHSLADLVDLALRTNPDTRVAWESARAAAAQHGRERSTYYPQIDIGTEASYRRYPFENEPKLDVVRVWALEPGFALTWLLIDFGRRNAANEAAREQLAAANFSFNRRLQDVVFQVQSAYYELEGSRALVRAAERNLVSAEAVLEAAQERMDLGLETRPSFLLAVQKRAQADYGREESQVRLTDAQAALALAVGLPANQPLRVQDLSSQPLPAALDPEVERLIEEGLVRRPDLAARSAELRASAARVRAAEARFWPQLSLEGGWAMDLWRYKLQGSPFRGSEEPDYRAGFAIRWPIFDGFERINALRKARAEHRRSQAELRGVELLAIAEVWRSYYQFKAASKKYQLGLALIEASSEAYESTLESYRRGLATIVQLLTAESDLAQARFVLVDSRATLLLAASTLAYAGGAIEP